MDYSDALKSESLRKVVRIAMRRAASLPDDVVDSPAVTDCVDQHTSVQHEPTYTDASVATDPNSGTVFELVYWFFWTRGTFALFLCLIIFTLINRN